MVVPSVWGREGGVRLADTGWCGEALRSFPRGGGDNRGVMGRIGGYMGGLKQLQVMDTDATEEKKRQTKMDTS